MSDVTLPGFEKRALVSLAGSRKPKPGLGDIQSLLLMVGEGALSSAEDHPES